MLFIFIYLHKLIILTIFCTIYYHAHYIITKNEHYFTKESSARIFLYFDKYILFYFVLSKAELHHIPKLCCNEN